MPRDRLLVVLSLLMVVAVSACQYLPPLPELPGNPFAAAPTSTPFPASAPSPVALAASPAPTRPAFAPFWIKNHRVTGMWSGPEGQSGVVNFGTTSSQFCSFQVVRPADGSRLYVLNPYSDNYFWIDADAVGPVPNPPEHKPGPKPADQNCTEAIYDG
ncbi:MAG: hypothetical protein IT305_00605 [Chloroflexi bacterium]|nr:hypothetical protein [Chloroflexota bacterium]